MKSILISLNITEKVQTDKNRREYILFIIDVCFTKYFLAVEINEKDHIDRDLIFEERRQEALEKNLVLILLGLIRVKKTTMQTR